METKNTFRFTIDLPKEEHKRLKTMSALSGKSMRDIIVEALNTFYKGQEYLHSNNPNAETRQILDEIKRDEGLIKCNSLGDLFNKLDI